jgi:hypothetical protein
VVYDAGIGLSLGKIIKIYYPLAFSSDLKSEIVLPNYQNPLERIVFTLDFTNPFDTLRKIGT